MAHCAKLRPNTVWRYGGDGIDFGTPRPLFRSAVPPADQVETCAVAPDGNRFLMLLPTAADATVAAQIIVNWPALLGDAPAE